MCGNLSTPGMRVLKVSIDSVDAPGIAVIPTYQVAIRQQIDRKETANTLPT